MNSTASISLWYVYIFLNIRLHSSIFRNRSQIRRRITEATIFMSRSSPLNIKFNAFNMRGLIIRFELNFKRWILNADWFIVGRRGALEVSMRVIVQILFVRRKSTTITQNVINIYFSFQSKWKMICFCYVFYHLFLTFPLSQENIETSTCEINFLLVHYCIKDWRLLNHKYIVQSILLTKYNQLLR